VMLLLLFDLEGFSFKIFKLIPTIHFVIRRNNDEELVSFYFFGYKSRSKFYTGGV
jgi:hypothetical protein